MLPFIKYFFLLALGLNLHFQVYAKSSKELEKEFVTSFQSIRSQINQSLENQDMKSFCSLAVKQKKILNNGWYYLRSSGYSYEELRENKFFINDNYDKNCF